MSLGFVSGTGTPARKMAEPDQDLRDRILRKLSKSQYYALRKVVCEVNNGVPTLRGRVPSYFLKQVAQSLVVEVTRRTVVVKNRLEVSKGRALRRRGGN